MSERQSTSNNRESSVTVTVSNEGSNTPQSEVNTVRLKLRKPKVAKKVNWSTGTVDNENMDKKKSKCCCIYKKARGPTESSSSDSDDECEHCHGHVEKKKKPPQEQSSAKSSTKSTLSGSTISSAPEKPGS